MNIKEAIERGRWLTCGVFLDQIAERIDLTPVPIHRRYVNQRPYRRHPEDGMTRRQRNAFRRGMKRLARREHRC